MKVYTSVTLSLETLEIVREESYEYVGPVAECKGGGNAGKVDFPAHMKTYHQQLLNHTGSDSPLYSVTDLMNSAWNQTTPYENASAYNPDARIAVYEADGDALRTAVQLLSSGTGLDTLTASVLDEQRVIDEVAAFEDLVDDDLLASTYPRFEAGMRDINAVTSSAFAVGRANIEASRLHEIAKFQSSLRMKTFGDDALKLIGLKLQFSQALAGVTTEQQRMAIVAKKEQNDYEIELDAMDAKWDLEIMRYGESLLGSIGGGQFVPKKDGPSPGASAIGGAMSGAAMGASAGPWGAVAGAVIGGVAGYASAQ